MLTAFGVKARLGQHQARDRHAVDDMRLDDFSDIFQLHVAVPDAFGIHHYVRPMLALIQATSFISSHAAFEPPRGEFLLEAKLQRRLARGIAAPTRIFGRALINADKNVMLELGHAPGCFLRFEGADVITFRRSVPYFFPTRQVD